MSRRYGCVFGRVRWSLGCFSPAQTAERGWPICIPSWAKNEQARGEGSGVIGYQIDFCDPIRQSGRFRSLLRLGKTITTALSGWCGSREIEINHEDRWQVPTRWSWRFVFNFGLPSHAKWRSAARSACSICLGILGQRCKLRCSVSCSVGIPWVSDWLVGYRCRGKWPHEVYRWGPIGDSATEASSFRLGFQRAKGGIADWHTEAEKDGESHNLRRAYGGPRASRRGCKEREGEGEPEMMRVQIRPISSWPSLCFPCWFRRTGENAPRGPAAWKIGRSQPSK